jgi:pyrroline-5-carboxylate reductase
MSRQPQVLLIGFGNMGRALAQGWLARGHAGGSIIVAEQSGEARAAAAAMGLAVLDTEAGASLPDVDVVLIAVKPGQVDEALRRWGALLPSAVFLSIAAGKTLSFLAARLAERTAVVRAMPNTPAAIGRGMTVLCANEHASQRQRALCETLLAAVGAVAWVRDERQMDAVTATSGSGPAYVFLLIEAMTDAAVELGLDRQLARELVTETVAGAGEYALQSGVDAAELRRQVTSPGGTTEAALSVLMASDGFGRLLQAALQRASERSHALSAD